ncbi:alpha/beta hydrolase [Mariniflexile litorale]|uniref:Alpha/beta hydrolase n=1 Tax=Mariniflexile litorale TaxID=3045158 RepID=A0AAU7EHB7_9FLAO|nr:alpha/beta hydrolase [Mariniflexile sp. KMM 9835]MDQ8211986.1 alpha/beta hydrolase [Mariniflexile sp. KMM 9835]
MNASKKVYFITGAFVNSTSWDLWKAYFESKGYYVVIPIWPTKEGTTKILKDKHPDSILGTLTLHELFTFYSELIKQEKEKPIAIGHSVGGLIVQILLQENLLSLGVAIHSAAPKGVISFQFSFFKSLWKPFGMFKSKNTPHLMSLEEWQYAFTNNMSLYDQKETYEKFLIPESRRIIRGLFTNAAKVKFNKKMQPLLFVAGSHDNLMPANLNFLNYKKYKNSISVTDYKEFEGINHFVLGGKHWEQTANYIINWVKQHEN